MKLNIGTRKRAEGWQAFDIMPGPEVDHVGNCEDLTRFPDATFETIYASHVLEHVEFRRILPVLAGWFRVLRPGGELLVSVPDFDILTRLYGQVDLRGQLFITQVMLGGQSDETDFHKAGFNLVILREHLLRVGFADIERVASFDLFDDSSRRKVYEVPISLNVKARRPA